MHVTGVWCVTPQGDLTGYSANPVLHLSMVRLITHNLLACHAKGCTTNNFPLKFSNIKLALRDADFNPDFLRGFLPRIEWDALVQASREVRKQFIKSIGSLF